ncbi:hypothetical protein F3157_00805 [Virgibacillus dakarensis]|uniref:ATP-grasp domain-containing protein n=1 Tax=Lentibacillus populi TaxID=1827502 RepID=A0A9W5X441_9BACI|nr:MULTISPECIES: hypothetical protein [Bacillaceae]MBT2215158.1 hypothetical protein [Virgibacillus dakarensis]MTW84210.1 hypothetical protein [Virgibacillus dakarensis]GGB28162.1 hypothetical protein GCM10011409_01910 [Lentibacillus populi]
MKYSGWLLYSKKDAVQNEAYIQWFIEEAGQKDMSLRLIFREDLTIGIASNQRTVLYNKKQVKLPDFAVIRTIEPLLSLHLEALGVPVFNSSRIAVICNNKALTHHHINSLGIPMVDTFFLKTDNLPSQPPITYPLVVKEALGRGGKQVYLIRNQAEWGKRKSAIAATDIVIQACNVSLGKDVRVFVVGKEIVGAVIRESNTDFRANYKLGGSAKWYSLKPEETAIINKIVQHFEFDMVGIDFLLDKNGKLLFNEIEDVVGSRTLSAVSDINILEKYTEHIKQQISTKQI